MPKMNKITYEKIIVDHMISLYCCKKHKNKTLCDDCEALKNYATERLSKCPFGDEKAACKDCKVHCYNKDMRERIREVMRFSGPRMFFYYPKDAFLHFKRK
jgi:hypothetical protein